MDTFIWVIIADAISLIFVVWAYRIDKNSVKGIYALFVIGLLVSRSKLDIKTRDIIYFAIAAIVTIRCSMIIFKNKYKLKKGIAPEKEAIKR